MTNITYESLTDLYKQHGLNDFKLKRTSDLFKVHDIPFSDFKGYNDLTSKNQSLFLEFVINFFNAQGLEERTKIKPKYVHWVQETEYFVNDDDDYSLFVGSNIAIVKSNFESEILSKDFDPLTDKHDSYFIKEYLRFGYERDGNFTFLHVLSPNHWY